MTSKILMPRLAGEFIAQHAQDVKIIPRGVSSCAEILAKYVMDKKIGLEAFKQNEVLPLDKGLSTDQLSNWNFLVDALNFNFWTPKGQPKFKVTHGGKTRSGYLAMVLAINRALDEGKPIWDPNYYSKLSADNLKEIFRSDNNVEIPLIDRRVEVVKEVGEKLINDFNGSFATIVKQSNNSAIKLVEIVTNNFPCFYDVHEYRNEKVAIFKRAQILAADVWLLYKGEAPGNFSDLDSLTMFADYRVPQSLVHFGVIEYSKELLEKLNNEHLFQSGDREEVEIRGVSIHAVELLVSATNNVLQELGVEERTNATKVDYFLWDYRVEHAKELDAIPYHKVRCCFY